MPAKSENQRRAAAMALSAKRGKYDVRKLNKSARAMYDSMTEEQLSHFAAKAVR